MEQKLDLTGINSQTLDPKQEKELFAALSDEELAEATGGSYNYGGHICGEILSVPRPELVVYDFEIGTRVQVTRCGVGWFSWSATIIDRKIILSNGGKGGRGYIPYYKVHFDNYTSDYDDWYEQSRLYI